MGKRAKGLRHAEKMKSRRAEKAAKQARYAALAGSGNNSKRNRGQTVAKTGPKVRDNSCRNIGDLVSHPEMIPSALRLYKLSQYTGKYKSMLREANLAYLRAKMSSIK